MGYWVLLTDGSVQNYGDAPWYGNGANFLPAFTKPATAIFCTSDGKGYWVATANGGVFNFGDAPTDGSMAGSQLNGSIIAGTGW
jgi:hypothetical protein